MKTITYKEITVNEDKVLCRLRDYMNRVSTYKNIDDSMTISIYVDEHKDFTAFDADDYRVQFVSNYHKIYETINSPYHVEKISFNTFHVYINNIR